MIGRSVVAALVVVSSLAFALPAFALNIADATPPQGTVGVPYSYTFSLSPGSGSAGATWSISSGALPPGLRLSSNDRTALVYGTPTQAGSFSFFIEVRDAPGPWVCCTQEEFTITINQALVISAGSDLPLGNLGQAYGYQLATAGGTANNWAVSAGALPAGMQLTPSGAIVGTPTQAAVSQFTVSASDGSKSASKQFTLKVTEPMILTAPCPEGDQARPPVPPLVRREGRPRPLRVVWREPAARRGRQPVDGAGGWPARRGRTDDLHGHGHRLGRGERHGNGHRDCRRRPPARDGGAPGRSCGQAFPGAPRRHGRRRSLKLKLAGATPAWLRLNPATGELSGTPKLKQPKPKTGKHGKRLVTRRPVTLTYSVYVTAWDTIGQRVAKKLKLTVKA